MKKLLFFLIFFCSIFFCSLINSKKGKIQGRKGQKQNFKIYSKLVLNELNQYRKLKIFAQPIEWDNNLANTADQEAFQLSQHGESFGQHTNFPKWKKSYEGFTEIAVNVFTNKLRSKYIFAMSVLEGLKEKYRFNIVQKFKKGGVGIYRDRKYSGKYIVVIHLAEDGNGDKSNLKDLSKEKQVKSKASNQKSKASNQKSKPLKIDKQKTLKQ